MFHRDYKYRIHFNLTQEKELNDILYWCRFLYNNALEERISYYKKYKKTLNYYDQHKHLKEIKKMFPEIKKIHSQVLQEVLQLVETSYQNFFRRLKSGGKAGFPRFKSSNSFKSILFPQIAKSAKKKNIKSLTKGGINLLPNGKIKIHGIIGEVKVKFHRPTEGEIYSAIIKKENDKYYLILKCKNVSEKTFTKTNKVTGIDLGIESFVTLDDGKKFHHPRSFKTSKEHLADKQRKLALKKRGSNNHLKAKLVVAKQHEKIKNQRHDFQHKLSINLIKEFDEIYIEDLNIKGMLGNEASKSLHREIMDASWGTFVEKLIYKAESANRLIVKVPANFTSQMCSCCGGINKHELKDRIYSCQSCGLVMDRDHNAAINIKVLGIKARNGSERAIENMLSVEIGSKEANDLNRW